MSLLTNLLDHTCSSDFKMEQVLKLSARGPYDLIENNNDTLLVTIGDSWTYGSRLAEEYPANPERGRIEHCYGYHLSQHLKADFLNYSVPGANNLWMIEKYKTLVQLADQLDYKKIIIFIALTEYGREISTDFDLDPSLNDLYRLSNTPRDLAVALSQHIANQLLSTKHSKIKLVLGLNYVNNIYPKELNSYFIDKFWLECILGKTIDTECLAVGTWAIEKFKLLTNEFNPLADQTMALNEVISMIEQGETRLNLIYNSGHNYKEGYGHPNSMGHKIWADYITSKIDDILDNQNTNCG